jgi:hypothetical protein
MLMFPQNTSALRFPKLGNAHLSRTRMEHPPTIPTLTPSESAWTLGSDLHQTASLYEYKMMLAVACSQANAPTQQQPGPGPVEGEMR